MPGLNEVQRNRRTGAYRRWDGSGWQSYQPQGGTPVTGSDLTDSPMVASIKGFARGAAEAATPTKLGLLSALLTGGSSVPVQMAAGAGAQALSDFLGASTGASDAPKSVGEGLSNAAEAGLMAGLPTVGGKALAGSAKGIRTAKEAISSRLHPALRGILHTTTALNPKALLTDLATSTPVLKAAEEVGSAVANRPSGRHALGEIGDDLAAWWHQGRFARCARAEASNPNTCRTMNLNRTSANTEIPYRAGTTAGERAGVSTPASQNAFTGPRTPPHVTPELQARADKFGLPRNSDPDAFEALQLLKAGGEDVVSRGDVDVPSATISGTTGRPMYRNLDEMVAGLRRSTMPKPAGKPLGAPRPIPRVDSQWGPGSTTRSGLPAQAGQRPSNLLYDPQTPTAYLRQQLSDAMDPAEREYLAKALAQRSTIDRAKAASQALQLHGGIQ